MSSRAPAARSWPPKPASGNGWCVRLGALCNTQKKRKSDMFWRRRRRLDEEIQSHLAEDTADNIARGMDPAKARYTALRTFGNVESAKEKARELDPLYWLDTLWQDTCFAGRLVARNPWISAT